MKTGLALFALLIPFLSTPNDASSLVDVIYPPVVNGSGRTPLYFSLIQSFSGQYISAYSLPGLEMALDFINGDDTLLPGYSLHFVLTEAAVNHYL